MDMITEEEFAADAEAAEAGVSLNDFYAFMPTHSYIFVPSREMWPSSSINARISPIQIGDVDGKPKTISSRSLFSSAGVHGGGVGGAIIFPSPSAPALQPADGLRAS
jgi:hypothetical protein